VGEQLVIRPLRRLRWLLTTKRRRAARINAVMVAVYGERLRDDIYRPSPFMKAIK
jgi:hypothetical protein